MISAELPVLGGRADANSRAFSDAPMAVIDIGSNSIRLVIYASRGRYPFPLFNERSNCRLGEGLGPDGMLHQDRIDVALATLSRFASIMTSMGVAKIYPVATAAVRRATNAEMFTVPARKILDQDIIVLTQQEEAHYVSRGITLNVPLATGLVADLGGGSLEVVALKDGVVRHSTSFDFGHLSDVSKQEIDAALAATPWLEGASPDKLYGVGGSFRALGSAYIEQSGYPLAVLHGLTIPAMAASHMLAAFARDLPDLSGVPLGRHKTMPMAAQIMHCLLRHCGAGKLFVSGTSIRDGILAENQFNAAERADFLQAVCSEISRASHRFTNVPETLFQLLRPLYASGADADQGGDRDRKSSEPTRQKKFERLLYAACLLSDLCWNEHEDIRGDLAARRVLGLPVNCISHKERIWLATVIYHRYVGRKLNKSRPPELGFILGRNRRSEAATIGLGLRFSLMYSGGTARCLKHLSLTNEGGVLTLTVAPEGRKLMDSHARRRFAQMAQSASLVPVIEEG